MMSKLASLVLALSLAAPSAAIAEPIVRGNVQLRVDLPKIIIRDRDRTPPRGYIRFDTYDSRYDRVERWNATYDISGTYDTEYGRITLTQDGNRVRGEMEQGGMLKGRIRNGTLYFRWQTGGAEGRGILYINNGRSRDFAGTWGTFDSASNAGSLNLHRVGVSRYDRYRDNYRYNDRRDYNDRDDRPYRRY